MRHTVKECAIVVLAAGMSSRLGSPKQLLVYKDKTLLQHTIDEALQTGIRPVIVVLGANSHVIKKEINNAETELVENEQWQQGMASSMCCGLAEAQRIKPGTDGIIFMVCDQPYLTSSLLNSLLTAQQESGLPIAASSYGNNVGTPALFHKSFFGRLTELKGDTGARKLISQYGDLLVTVTFPKGIVDIDTRTDYDALPE